mmetsp:Transcript_31511/g.84080  ORF Transcript_31511/g.84080 Transcript_31511/m.84080 type:complete len:263 (-) Transcript_31511:85-873(-)
MLRSQKACLFVRIADASGTTACVVQGTPILSCVLLHRETVPDSHGIDIYLVGTRQNGIEVLYIGCEHCLSQLFVFLHVKRVPKDRLPIAKDLQASGALWERRATLSCSLRLVEVPNLHTGKFGGNATLAERLPHPEHAVGCPGEIELPWSFGFFRLALVLILVLVLSLALVHFLSLAFERILALLLSLSFAFLPLLSFVIGLPLALTARTILSPFVVSSPRPCVSTFAHVSRGVSPRHLSFSVAFVGAVSVMVPAVPFTPVP